MELFKTEVKEIIEQAIKGRYSLDDATDHIMALLDLKTLIRLIIKKILS